MISEIKHEIEEIRESGLGAASLVMGLGAEEFGLMKLGYALCADVMTAAMVYQEAERTAEENDAKRALAGGDIVCCQQHAAQWILRATQCSVERVIMRELMECNSGMTIAAAMDKLRA